jgi:hypothetical protein
MSQQPAVTKEQLEQALHAFGVLSMVPGSKGNNDGKARLRQVFKNYYDQQNNIDRNTQATSEQIKAMIQNIDSGNGEYFNESEAGMLKEIFTNYDDLQSPADPNSIITVLFNGIKQHFNPYGSALESLKKIQRNVCKNEKNQDNKQSILTKVNCYMKHIQHMKQTNTNHPLPPINLQVMKNIEELKKTYIVQGGGKRRPKSRKSKKTV